MRAGVYALARAGRELGALYRSVDQPVQRGGEGRVVVGRHEQRAAVPQLAQGPTPPWSRHDRRAACRRSP